MTRLSVNINKIATIRNARGGEMPNVAAAAQRIMEFGAAGITVHPRPDERHIRYEDVHQIAALGIHEFNIEGYPSDDWMKLVLEAKPDQATLVPDPPEALTSDSGWDTIAHQTQLQEVIDQLKSQGIRTSIFIGTDLRMIEAATETGTDRIELYTEPFAAQFEADQEQAVAPFVKAAAKAHELGLGVNAGHDLNLENLAYFQQQVKYLDEVSIGHALVSDALYFGLENTVQMYLSKLA